MDYKKSGLFTLVLTWVIFSTSCCNALNKKKENSPHQVEKVDTVKSIHEYCFIDSFFQSNFYYDSTCNLISIRNPVDFFNDNLECLLQFTYDEVRNFKLKLPQQRCNSKNVDNYQIWTTDGLTNQKKGLVLFIEYNFGADEFITQILFGLNRRFSNINTRKSEGPSLGNDEVIWK